MQKPLATDSPVTFQSELLEIRTRVNAVDVFPGEEVGIFIPESDPQGGKRPFVMVPANWPIEAIQALTGRARARYDFLREIDGYDPLRW